MTVENTLHGFIAAHDAAVAVAADFDPRRLSRYREDCYFRARDAEDISALRAELFPAPAVLDAGHGCCSAEVAAPDAECESPGLIRRALARFFGC